MSGEGESVAASRPPPTGAARFGAFAGVFTPSVLTILGVVMYLRVGWVVGNVGLGGALLIVVIAHAITLATGLCVASIATNRTVGVGGAYFIISRSLGAPAGAAIGIPLFLAQALSITFYIVGFTESLTMLWPDLPERTVSSVVLLVLALISMKSADLALKLQFVVMTAIALSLLSIFGEWSHPGGVSEAVSELTWWRTDQTPFADVFAVFFPAVTGIMAGVGMSGDLKDPRSAIPRGTLLAILVGFIVYMLLPVWLALNSSPDELLKDTKVAWDVARFPALVYAGVWGATLSSAVGCILTAPRTLQALANDGLLPQLFGRGYGPNNEPRVGVVLSYLLAQCGILLGGLDVIAPVLTMFFLATYGLINLTSALEQWAESPSFRPSFSIPTTVGLIGGAGCIYVMSIINLPAMLMAAVLSGAIYVLTQRRALSTTYGDARHGLWAALVRSALHWLRGAEFHPTNWRPNLLVLGGDLNKRPWLLTLGSAVVQGRGIVTYVRLLEGDVQELADSWRTLRQDLNKQLQETFPHVFGKVGLAHNKYRGAVSVAQAYGMGTLEANTVMLGWPTRAERNPQYVRMLRDLAALDRSLLIVRHNPSRGLGRGKRIDIWWGGLQQNGGLMLLVGYLITAQGFYRGATVTVRTVLSPDDQQSDAEERINAVLQKARLSATASVIVDDGRPVVEVMHEHSRAADLAIIGLRLPPEQEQADMFFDRVNAILEDMPTTILVHSARNFVGEPVLFDGPKEELEAQTEDPSSAISSVG